MHFLFSSSLVVAFLTVGIYAPAAPPNPSLSAGCSYICPPASEGVGFLSQYENIRIWPDSNLVECDYNAGTTDPWGCMYYYESVSYAPLFVAAMM